MPNKQSARKALRQATKRAAQNKIVKETYKQALKTVRKGMEAEEKDLKEKLRLAQKSLDKAAKRGVIKKNAAGRKLSRVVKRVRAAQK